MIVKVKELMERVGSSETGRIIAYIKDGLDEMNMIGETHVTTQRIDINTNQRFYDIPNDAIRILDIRCKNQGNAADEYRSIPRTINPPSTEDADGI